MSDNDVTEVKAKKRNQETLASLEVPPAPEEPDDIKVMDNPWRDERMELLKRAKEDDKSDEWEFMYADPEETRESLERKGMYFVEKAGKVVKYNRDPIVKKNKKEWQQRQIRDARLASERSRTVTGANWRKFSHKRNPREPVED